MQTVFAETDLLGALGYPSANLRLETRYPDQVSVTLKVSPYNTIYYT